ncbi:MAG: Flp pilus assembly secretin CpaC [Pirellulaceae bacterium]|jgi:Flp pilus assembly secretin CpaC
MFTKTLTSPLAKFGVAALLIAAVLSVTVSSLRADPLEEIPVTANLTMKHLEGKHIITKAGIYRISVTNKSICDARIVTPTQISLIARQPGKTHVTFWMVGHEGTPSKIEINVLPKKKKK